MDAMGIHVFISYFGDVKCPKINICEKCQKATKASICSLELNYITFFCYQTAHLLQINPSDLIISSCRLHVNVRDSCAGACLVFFR